MIRVGQALTESGDSYKRLAEAKYSLEENVKQNFLDPMHLLQDKDLREVNVSHSKRSASHCADQTFSQTISETTSLSAKQLAV